MGKWYIDRSRNVSSIISSIHYDLLKQALNTPILSQDFIDPNVLIDIMQIDGANKNALLSNFRDLGLINTSDNKPSSFFNACTNANLSIGTTVLLILLKRNDDKKVVNHVKPFVVMAKALALMIKHNITPELTWTLCNDYLMNIDSYAEITWEYIYNGIKSKKETNVTSVLDIWFNALIATGLFSGDKKKVQLKEAFYDFISFIAEYGHEMQPSTSRDEYVDQACDLIYGWYNLFVNHSYEAICALKTLPELIAYIQSVDSLKGDNVKITSYSPISTMQKNDLKRELAFLEHQYEDIALRIKTIKERLNVMEENDKYLHIKTNAANKELFTFYLLENKKLSEHTVFSYFSSLEKMRDLLKQYESIEMNTEFYFIADISIAESLIKRFESNAQLREINKETHYSISASYNNYFAFLETIGEIG